MVRKIAFMWYFRTLLLHPGKTLRVLSDTRTPIAAKVLFALAILYVFMPIDIVPDWIPLLGQIDDVAIVVSVATFALRMIPDEVYRKHSLMMAL